MGSSLLRRLIDNLPKLGKKSQPRSFVKQMLQADVVSSPFRDSHVFRPRLEILEDRLAPAVSFTPQTSFAVGLNPAITATADINGDGKPDLIAANYGANTISVLLNTTPNGATAPTFGPQFTFTVGPNPNGVAVADVNGDGKPDIAVTNYSAGSTTITILMNTTAPGATAPSFAPEQTFSVGGYSSTVAFADINGDGRPDLVVAVKQNSNVSVFMNETPAGATAASFGPQQTFATGNLPYSVAVADINGDGRPDLVVTNYVADTISVLLNTTAPGSPVASFAPQQTFSTDLGPFGLAIADINGDGRPDVAVTNYRSDEVQVLLNMTPAGSTAVLFSTAQTFATGDEPLNLAVGDFTGDGKPDFVVGNVGSDSISVLQNTTPFGATTASFLTQQTYATTGPAAVPVVADFNGDGRDDIAVSSGGLTGDSVCVFLNNLPTTSTTVTGPVVVGDFTGYGVDELNHTTGIWSRLTPSDSTVLAANANGWVVGDFSNGVNFYRPGVGWVLISPSQASSLDIDAQGNIVGNFPGYGIYYYKLTTGWQQISTATSPEVRLDAYGNVFAIIPGYGINGYELAFPGSWYQVTPVTPTTFAVNAYGEIVASFSGGGYNGVYDFLAYSGWQRLSTATSNALTINTYGVIFGNFPGYGVNTISPTQTMWTATTPTSASILDSTRYGQAYGAFPGAGTYTFNPLKSWSLDSSTTAAALTVADWPFSLQSPF